MPVPPAPRGGRQGCPGSADQEPDAEYCEQVRRAEQSFLIGYERDVHDHSAAERKPHHRCPQLRLTPGPLFVDQPLDHREGGEEQEPDDHGGRMGVGDTCGGVVGQSGHFVPGRVDAEHHTETRPYEHGDPGQQHPEPRHAGAGVCPIGPRQPDEEPDHNDEQNRAGDGPLDSIPRDPVPGEERSNVERYGADHRPGDRLRRGDLRIRQ